MYDQTMKKSNPPSAPSFETPRPDQPGQAGGGNPGDPLPPEYGGRKNGPDPTRYGDWEKDGKCVDF
jgi:hypothetical protein